MFLLLLHFRLTAHASSPDLGNGHRQPEPFDTAGILHFAVVPAPQTTFEIFEATFDPGTHCIPTDFGLFG